MGNAMMNAQDNCCCKTKGNCDYFNVGEDADGNSILTGDGGKGNRTFTLAAIETWAVSYS